MKKRLVPTKDHQGDLTFADSSVISYMSELEIKLVKEDHSYNPECYIRYFDDT